MFHVGQLMPAINLSDRRVEEKIARPKESQLKLEVEFHRVPYNQTFDFVTL